MNSQEVVIVSASRTPIGTFCGSLSSLKASELGSVVIRESIARAQLQSAEVSEVIFGQVLTSGQGQNPARQAAINAGLPVTVPAYGINMLCGSGLKAVANAYLTLKAGEGKIIVAGGQESMSQAPHAHNLRTGTKLGDVSMKDLMLHDGLTDAFAAIHMGITAENVAKDYKISREEQDKFAAESQRRAEVAIAKGYFEKEIVPVIVKGRYESITVSKDEFPKSGVTVDDLSRLKPVFIKSEGTVTAGNASGINDGAAALVLMTAETAKSKRLEPLGYIVAIAESGIEPRVMGIAPVSAVKLVLEKAKWKKEEVDLFELNEAFAAQSVACINALGLDPSKVNINGGAIALGHPIGASGARVLVTLLHALERTNGTKGVASLCIGGGMGIAIAVERK